MAMPGTMIHTQIFSKWTQWQSFRTDRVLCHASYECKQASGCLFRLQDKEI